MEKRLRNSCRDMFDPPSCLRVGPRVRDRVKEGNREKKERQRRRERREKVTKRDEMKGDSKSPRRVVKEDEEEE